MHLPNPLPNELYRGQMFAPMLNKHKHLWPASADAQGELGDKILSFLQDAGPEWRWWMKLAVASKEGLAVGLGSRVGRISTRHLRCARWRQPGDDVCASAGGGACGGAGRGGTCGWEEQLSVEACPGRGPRRDCPHQRPQREDRCCRAGSRCLPEGSWCCNLHINRQGITINIFGNWLWI